MSGKSVNRRWLLAAGAELPFAPFILAVWDDLPRLVEDPTTLSVLRALIVEWQRHGDGESKFEVRQAELAAQTRLSERSVHGALAALVRDGLLGKARDGFRGAARYDVLPLLRLVRITEDPQDVRVTTPAPAAGLPSENGHRDPHVAPRHPHVVQPDPHVAPVDPQDVRVTERGSATDVERREARRRVAAMRALPLATADVRRAVIDAALKRLAKDETA